MQSLTEVCKTRINTVFKRAKRFGFTDTVYDVNELREHADECLFNQIQSDFHCLHQILPPIKPDCTYLRARGHDYIFYRSLTNTCIDHHLCRDVCIIICNRFAIYFKLLFFLLAVAAIVCPNKCYLLTYLDRLIT
jgi:hypothetical protein